MAMKTLFLLRHAKSSWDDTQLNDHDRHLNSRGLKSAPRMGRLLKQEGVTIDLILCSSSVRTRETAKLVLAELPNPPAISYREELYHATPDQITNLLSQTAEPAECVMVIGHNPGLEEFLERLTGEVLHFPTAGLAKIELEIDRWNLFDNQIRGQLKQFWKPRELDAE